MKNATLSVKITNIVIYLAIGLFGVICVYPFLNAVAISFNDPLDSLKGGIYLLPRVYTYRNYVMIFMEENIAGSYIISISRTVIGSLMSVVVITLFCFAVTRKEFVGKKFFNYMIVIPMYFGGGFLPTYLINKSYGLVNNFWVLVLPAVVWSFGIILFKTFLLALPAEIEDAAAIDGAGHVRALLYIVVPLSMPIISVIVLFVAVGHWNDWYTGVAYFSNIKKYPSASLLYKMLQDASSARDIITAVTRITGVSTVTPQALKMTMLVVITAPILIIYPFLQKHFEQGMMIGAIKG